MNVRKFIAATARDGLHKVKEVLGPDAIILSNRAIPGGVEIMAVSAQEMEAIMPSPLAHREQTREDYSVSLSSQAKSASQAPLQKPAFARAYAELAESTANISETPKPSTSETLASNARVKPNKTPAPDLPAAQPAAASPEVVGEIRALRQLVEQHVVGMAWGESARSEPVKTEVLRQMLDAGFSPQFSRQQVEGLPRELSAPEALNWVKNKADRSFLSIDASSDLINKGGIYALIGPTGVGKTTTTAKLAARCVLRHGAHKVALITTDAYRIGAHEQLRIYGRILGVPVHLAKNAEELQQTLLDLQHKHMVLIDTIGMSQRDKMVDEQVAMFGNSVKRLLLLSATSRGDTLDDVVRVYCKEDIEGCIISKIDESASLAASLDVIIRHNLRLYYISNGQRVPEDLHLPNRAYLLHKAFKTGVEMSPHYLQGIESGLMMVNAASEMMRAGEVHG